MMFNGSTNAVKWRYYRSFIENLTTSGRDPATVLDADYARTVARCFLVNLRVQKMNLLALVPTQQLIGLQEWVKARLTVRFIQKKC